MKHNLIAIATLTALGAGSACAQSSVTLFGIVDATFAYGSGSIANMTQVTSSGYNNSRLGFRGTEDLGGGMSASFWLEAGMNNDTGSGQATNLNNQIATTPQLSGGGGLTFNRRSTVSLAGQWGELRLGRDFSTTFWNTAVFDPFGTRGAGGSQVLASTLGGPTGILVSNSIGYILPASLGGLYGQLQYFMGENSKTGAATDKDGTGFGGRVGYAQGPVNAAMAYSSTNFASGNVSQFNIGGQWDLGMVRLLGEYARDRVGTPRPVVGQGAVFGGQIPVGVGEIRLAVSRYKTDAAGEPGTNKVSLGYVHNLSKRTAVYAGYGRLRNSGGASLGINGAITSPSGKSTGFDIGLRHAF